MNLHPRALSFSPPCLAFDTSPGHREMNGGGIDTAVDGWMDGRIDR